ncbi:hypothetical protein Hanom_Chr15g01371201 [Helianthus anomalus]
MMLGRMGRKSRPVVREKSGEDAPLWRIFDPGFKGKVEVLVCADGEEGFNFTIRDNFRLPEREVMEAVSPQGKGTIDGTLMPRVFQKKHVEKLGDKKLRKPQKPHDPVVVPPLVPVVVGISRICLCKYDDYVVVSDTLEGLGVLGGSAAASESGAGSKPTVEKKRKGDAAGAGGRKEPQEEIFSLFDVPPSPSRDAVADVGVNKEFRRSPYIEVVTPPSAHAEDTRKKAAGQTIVDTVDSSDNLIELRDTDVEGVRNQNPLM